MTDAISNPELAPLVGIVLVNFHTAVYLHRCLLALKKQTRPADSIVVINNGDAPGSLDFITQEYPSVLVLHQSNIGFAAANNLALNYLEGHDWIGLLNPDAFPEAEWLEQLLLAAHADPETSVFSSQLLRAGNKHISDGDGDSYHFSGLAWRHNHGRPSICGRKKREVFSACAAAALYKRDALMDIDGFDSSYFCYFEDVDLGFRLRLRGHRCLHIPTARVQHVGSGASGGEQQSDFALYHGHRNLVWTFVKNMPGIWFWLLLPAHVLMNVVGLTWYACKGRHRVIFRAKIDALKKIPMVWRQRKTIQAQRAVAPITVVRHMSFWPLTMDK